MKLDEIEEMLVEDILDYKSGRFTHEASRSFSNAVQALIMVRQEIDRQKALEANSEPEKTIKGNPFI